jgi:hypothetical protein
MTIGYITRKRVDEKYGVENVILVKALSKFLPRVYCYSDGTLRGCALALIEAIFSVDFQKESAQFLQNRWKVVHYFKTSISSSSSFVNACAMPTTCILLDKASCQTRMRVDETDECSNYMFLT